MWLLTEEPFIADQGEWMHDLTIFQHFIWSCIVLESDPYIVNAGQVLSLGHLYCCEIDLLILCQNLSVLKLVLSLSVLNLLEVLLDLCLVRSRQVLFLEFPLEILNLLLEHSESEQSLVPQRSGVAELDVCNLCIAIVPRVNLFSVRVTVKRFFCVFFLFLLKKFREIKPQFHLEDSKVLRSFIKFHAIDLYSEPGHLDNVFVHGLNVLLVEVLESPEHHIGNDDAQNV